MTNSCLHRKVSVRLFFLFWFRISDQNILSMEMQPVREQTANGILGVILHRRWEQLRAVTLTFRLAREQQDERQQVHAQAHKGAGNERRWKQRRSDD